MSITIRTQPAPTSPQEIADLGITIPGNGGSLTLTDPDELYAAAGSESLKELATGGSPVLVVSNAGGDINPAYLQDAIIASIHADSGPYSDLVRDESGDLPPDIVGGGGITELAHRTLRQLIHLADSEGPMEGFTSGAYRETTPTGSMFPTLVTWWTSSSKLNKIVDKQVTYTGAFATSVVWRAYDTDGTTVLVTITDTIVYSGAAESTRTRTIS